jgi:hypothetical protein
MVASRSLDQYDGLSAGVRAHHGSDAVKRWSEAEDGHCVIVSFLVCVDAASRKSFSAGSSPISRNGSPSKANAGS